MAGNLGNPGNPTDPGTPTSSREGELIPAGQVVYDSTLDRYFLGDGVTLGGNEILGARYDAADRSITFDKLSQGAIDYIDASGGASDHGGLTGLGDDDHPQYLLADGTRSVSGDLDVTGDVTIGGQVEIPRQVSYGTRHLGTFYPLVGLGSANQRIFGDLISNTGKRYQIKGNGDLEMMTNARNVIFKNGALNAETLRILSDGTLQPVGGNLLVSGTVNGRDIAADGAALDTKTGTTGNYTVAGNWVFNGFLNFNTAIQVNSTLNANATAIFNGQMRINSTLRPQTGPAAAVDLGSSSFPFRNLFLWNQLRVGDDLLLEGDAVVDGSITVDGTVDGRDVAADGTKLDGIQAAVTVGSTAPVSPSGGDLWYHTTDQEMYAYDSSRSKWLSVNTYEAHFGQGGSLTTNHYMKGPGNFEYNTGGASPGGYPLRYDATVVAAWGSVANGTSGWNHRIMKYDDSAAGNVVAATYAPSGTYTRWDKQDFDLDYDVSDLLALNMQNTGGATTATNHTATIAYKRRPS